MQALEPPNVGLAFLRHLPKDFAGLTISQRRRQAPALLDPISHPGDNLKVFVGHSD